MRTAKTQGGIAGGVALLLCSALLLVLTVYLLIINFPYSEMDTPTALELVFFALVIVFCVTSGIHLIKERTNNQPKRRKMKEDKK